MISNFLELCFNRTSVEIKDRNARLSPPSLLLYFRLDTLSIVKHRSLRYRITGGRSPTEEYRFFLFWYTQQIELKMPDRAKKRQNLIERISFVTNECYQYVSKKEKQRWPTFEPGGEGFRCIITWCGNQTLKPQVSWTLSSEYSNEKDVELIYAYLRWIEASKFYSLISIEVRKIQRYK